MAKDKGDRYQSWEDLTKDIQGQLKGREDLNYRQDAGVRSVRKRGPSSGRRS